MVGWVGGREKNKFLRHALVGEPPNVYPIHIQVEWCVRYPEASRDQFHHASARILSRSIPHQWNKFIVSSSFAPRILRSYLHVSIHQFAPILAMQFAPIQKDYAVLYKQAGTRYIVDIEKLLVPIQIQWYIPSTPKRILTLSAPSLRRGRDRIAPGLLAIHEQPVLQHALLARLRARDLDGAELRVAVGDVPAGTLVSSSTSSTTRS